MSIPNPIQTYRLLQTEVTALRFEEQLLLMTEWATRRASRFVSVANVHTLMEAYWNPQFAQALQNADLVTPDGMPLVWMLRAMGATEQDRVAGMDIFLRLCQLASLNKIGVFFLGADSDILEGMKTRLNREFPELILAGMKPLPFRPLTSLENEVIIQQINESGAGLLFVCLGCPKQELWIAQHKDKIHAVMIGVGAVFPIYAGRYQQAPPWMRKWGLEWVYRLTQEPKRLAPRYSKTIPPFIYLALQQLLALSLQRVLQQQKQL
ncbi:glycosyl transferase, WecB/TagA/CpsF family [Halothece sp. PCC 7418]|uniref:WecB/TagA/CpsF family glycosyltransferase n=1 Tax=Halothece sp. (strain PCC 7418) TaxID=65093 RepID=UPI0002A07737|nr:WecB/TagA/CpsF family glycosyltransferase [Halothece sp. PCC 7418]AFZ44063.1 glycosyl transferase, WecB/TagA/CpsF family [Halothece sp. PCC 7418]